jgi:hypothetical protein
MNKKTLIIGLATAGILAAGATAPNLADANHYYERGRYQNSGGEWAELRRDRQELWRDEAELARDRADLQRMYRQGASRAAIERKKAEIRNDMREVRRSQEEVRESYIDVRRDGYGYNGYDRGRRQRNDPGWWGWGNGWWNRNR